MPAAQTDAGELRGAQRFADPGSRAATSWCRRGTRAACRCSISPTRRTPVEIAFFDRGPIDAKQLVIGRLLVDVLVQRQHLRLGDRARHRHLQAEAERVPDAERDRRGDAGAASTSSTRSSRRRSRWPASSPVALAYVDQLTRSKAIQPERARAVKTALDQRRQRAHRQRASAAARRSSSSTRWRGSSRRRRGRRVGARSARVPRAGGDAQGRAARSCAGEGRATLKGSPDTPVYTGAGCADVLQTSLTLPAGL